MNPKITSPFKIIKYWVFDLDNTLYPASSNLFLKIDSKMKKFIIKKLNVNENEAYKIQKKYYLKYGTTLFGLMKNHNIIPEEYLKYVHDIDISSIKNNTELNNQLKSLPGKKYIYTNGSKSHAINIIKQLGLDNKLFEIFDIKTAKYIPKPSKISLKYFVEKYKIKPTEAIFFEDISINLIEPKKAKFKTVLIKNNFHPDKNTDLIKKEKNNYKYIDYITQDLTRFLNQINLDISK